MILEIIFLWKEMKVFVLWEVEPEFVFDPLQNIKSGNSYIVTNYFLTKSNMKILINIL